VADGAKNLWSRCHLSLLRLVSNQEKKVKPVADNKNEAVVREFLRLFHEAAVPDFSVLMEFFAEDGQYHTLVPDGAVFTGKAAIRKCLETQFETYNDCDCEIHALGSSGSVVFTERTDHVTLTKDGRKVNSRVCAVFELNPEGHIQSWREYWDTGNIVKQMGITRDELDKDIA
jgi:limonene-1,2-epoxide hydrolase